MFGEREEHETPVLYNLSHDPSEQYDIAEDHPEVIERIDAFVKEHQAKLVVGEDQLAERE